MAALTFWALVGLATIAGLAMAWTLGANSNSPPFAPVIGANAISTMRGPSSSASSRRSAH